jgi:hypothetical protein
MNKIPEKRILAVSKPLPKLLADLDLLEMHEKEQVSLVSTEQGIIALSKSPKGEQSHAERKENPTR